MASGDKIIMSVKELWRVHVIHQVMKRKMRHVEAGGLLGVTDRQVRRLLKRVRVEGDDGLVHRRRGKSSNRVIDGGVRKAHRGELVQMDGWHHAWLEDRGPARVLMGHLMMPAAGSLRGSMSTKGRFRRWTA